MSIKDVIFIVSAVAFIRYLYRRELLDRVIKNISLVLFILTVWLVLIIFTWRVMVFFGVPEPAAIIAEILGGRICSFWFWLRCFIIKNKKLDVLNLI